MRGSYTIRPNSQNPEWPTEPHPDDLKAELERAEKAKDPKRAKKEAPAKALLTTQHRVAAQHRQGAGSPTDNLDWLAMLRGTRSAVRRADKRLDGGTDYTWCWVDTHYPGGDEVIEVMPHVRYGPWSTHGGSGHRYCYVTLEVAR